MARPGIIRRLLNLFHDKNGLVQQNVSGGPTLVTSEADTLIGSPFPSPEYHEMVIRNLYGGDWIKRCELYQKIDDLFLDPIPSTACHLLCRQAVNTDFNFSITPKKDTGRNRMLTQRATEICREVKSLMPKEVLGTWGYDLGKYGNYPVQVVANSSGVITELIGHAPYGFQINANVQNRFDKAQKDAYVQFDTLTRQVVAEFAETQIVWGAVNRSTHQVYGGGYCLTVMSDIEDLKKSWEKLREARESLLPRKVIVTPGVDNQGMDAGALLRFKLQRFAARILRGEKISPYEDDIINGQAEVKMLSANTNYLSDLTDLDKRAARVAAAFRVPLPLIIGIEECTADLVDAMENLLYKAQEDFAGEFALRVIIPVFVRALRFQKIDVDDFDLEIKWNQHKPPARLLQESEAAGRGAQTMLPDGKPIISCTTARKLTAAYLKIDFQAEIQQIDAEEIEREEAQMKKMEQQQQMLMGGENPAGGPPVQANVLAFNKTAAAKKDGDAEARKVMALKQNDANRKPEVQASKGTSPGKGAPK